MPRSVNCHLALLLCLLVAGEWFSLAQGQVLKPEVLVLPVKFAGVGDANAREILQQYVLTELSGSYELKSEREVAAARERAVDKLASSDCTEEACLKVMGELLDVDYTFAVSVTASGDFWDLTGVRLEPLGRTVRKNVSCERCTLPKAKARLTELLLGLRPGAVGLGKGEAVLIIESEPSGQVFVQGRPQGSTPIEVTVPTRDPVDILIVAEGYTDFAKVYDALRPGERIHETVRLVRKRGRVGLASQPSGANIRLDGELLRDESGNLQTTPLELRLEYGEHTVIVSQEHYENARRAFTVEKPDHRKIELTLKPLPGRLVVRVPSKYRNARVLVDGSDIGGMSGEIAKTFEVEAETRLRVQARQGNANSETETVWLEADGSQTVSFENFTEMTPPRSRASEKELEWLEGGSFGLGTDYFSLRSGRSSSTCDRSLSFSLAGPEIAIGHLQLQVLNGTGSVKVGRSSSSSSYSSSSSTSCTGLGYTSSSGSWVEITGSNASVLRVLYSSLGEGWGGSLGYESVTFNFDTTDGTKTAKLRHPLLNGFYRWEGSDMYLNLKLRVSFSYGSEIGKEYSVGFGAGLGVPWD